MLFKIKSKCNLTQRAQRKNTNTKATKSMFFGVLCIELCVLCVNMYLFSFILNSSLKVYSGFFLARSYCLGQVVSAFSS
jgi:hypothetical protein